MLAAATELAASTHRSDMMMPMSRDEANAATSVDGLAQPPMPPHSALPAAPTVREHFFAPDFVLHESPVLERALFELRGARSPVKVHGRPAAFPLVVLLMKLRWLLKLQAALVALGGRQCSLVRVVAGIRADTCGNHRFPHNPAQMCDAIMETLQTRLQKSWGLFIAFVASHPHADDPTLSVLSSRSANSVFGKSALMSLSQEAHAFDQQSMSTTIVSSANGGMWQVVDDIFVAWLMQQDSEVAPAAEVFQELDNLRIARPVVNVVLNGIREWHGGGYATPRLEDTASVAVRRPPLAWALGDQRSMRKAQQHAHRLALLLELPEAAGSSVSIGTEEILEAARLIVSHPQTFNPRVRARIEWHLKEAATPMEGALHASQHSIASTLDEEQLRLFSVRSAHPHDCPRLKASYLEKLRDRHPPWLVGREATW